MILSLFYLLVLLALAHAIPQVPIGDTTLIGVDTPGLKVEFFGGMIYHFPIRGARLKAILQGFLTPSLPSVICVCNHPFSKRSMM